MLDEINERAVEEALLIKERDGGEVIVLCAGSRPRHRCHPQGAVHGRRQGRSRERPALHGSDAIQTGWTLAARARTIGFEKGEAADLVIAATRPPTAASAPSRPSSPSTSACRSSPAAQADGRGREGHRATARDRRGRSSASRPAPAIVSVTEKINESALPVLQGHHAARRRKFRSSPWPTWVSIP
ncbi:hypothetical protein GS931_14355, partial [Rhodococcus hoagii]|nr:hypothetical protein [Prescottella equi]